ncbi:TWiK family of potassium channels protein 12 [Aphelenchoides besseyi]|nr:TWiK family of potassium channels protein 12 [Aphelenchoides besseyi]KAI6199976.1 TWiK family of potassium channels protein 12 [Aphelenchoides besseyi]
MHHVLLKLKWFYKRFKLSRYLPFIVLISYTVIGAAIFRHFELEPDEIRRAKYRDSTEYAFNQVLKRMLEIRCMDREMRYNTNLQTRHTKDALFWLIDYLNLTQVIEERSEPSPWSWTGALFYSGQLYSTIGYGLPVAQTSGGRFATILYILIGIPLFLIILKDVGRLLSRALRKMYKRLRSAKRKLPDARRMSEPVKAIYNLSMGPLAMLGADVMNNIEQAKQEIEEEQHSTDSIDGKPSQPPGILKKPIEDNGVIDAQKQNEENQKIHKKKGNIPIALALIILIIWIMFSSAMFCLWETEWSFGTSVYFYFVSISTVGLGDIVPKAFDLMLVNFALIMVGLALLSMVDWLERLLDQVLEEYLGEMERMADIVNHNEEYPDEAATPFEVGMTDMLTVPLTSIAQDEHRGGIWEIGRSAKDWVADRIATNLLVNRLDPQRYSDSESSSSESESEDDESTDETEADVADESLKEVVVDKQKRPEDEAAPLNPVTLGVRKTSHISTSTRGTMGKGDAISRVSTRGHAKKGKKPKKTYRLRQMNPFYAYNIPTLRAIQAIETVKMRTDRNGDFKSRLFAKFATNPRLTHLVDERPSPPTKMVSFSVQTSPIVEREHRPQRAAAYSSGIGLGSMDSFSSGVNANGGNDSATLKSFDIDSLCSSAYYDVNFHGYQTDSIPHMITASTIGSQQNTPPLAQKAGTSASPRHSYQPTRRPVLTPAITFDRSSGSPPDVVASTHSAPTYRRFSTANCLPIPIQPSDRVRELPILNSRMPLHRCPSCSNVATDTPVEPETVERVHNIVGIMPSDFLQHRHKSPSIRRPDSALSDYDNPKTSSHSSAQDSTAIFKTHIPKLRRSKRLQDDSGISDDVTNATDDSNPKPQSSFMKSDR